MSIYEKDSYSESKCVFLAGPIEAWWTTEEDPLRFVRIDAVSYREHRALVSQMLADAGFLTYRPHGAFQGPWNERLQGVNDFVLSQVDAVVSMTPTGILALGTDHEVDFARSLGKPILHCAPVMDIDPTNTWEAAYREHIAALIEDIKSSI